MKKSIAIVAAILVSLAYCANTLAQPRQVFHPDVRSANPSPVYDFIERYFTELEQYKDYELLRLRLRDDKVVVVDGTLDAISKIGPETPFSLNRMEDSFYQINWTKDDKDLLTLRFPVQFELLLGQSKAQMEKKMKDYLSSSPQREIPTVSRDGLDSLETNIYTTHPADFYQLESVTDVSYYECSNDGKFTPIYNNNQKAYSAANLFHGILPNSQQRLHIEQNLYGGNKDTYTINLDQWLDYCISNRLQIFFTIEEEREDGMQALLIAHSNELNYNHMMTVIIPDDFITDEKAVLKARFNAFIPTQNVKDLYQKYTTKAKKHI